MKNITDPSEIRNVAVFRALNLGDMLCAVPALRALRSWLPQARILYVGLPWSRAFYARFGKYIDEFIEFPGFPGLPEIEPDIRRIPQFLKQMQERSLDLAIQMHGNGTVTTTVVGLFGAAVTAGYRMEGSPFPQDGWPVPFDENLSEVDRWLALVEALGAPASEKGLEFPLTGRDHEELKELTERAVLSPRSYIVVHPGARVRARRWLPERFAEAADMVCDGKLQVVITGSENERDAAERMRSMMRFPAMNLAGKTTLGALAALINESALVLANDTAVSHIADALGVPSVIVVTASDPRRWRPRDESLHRIVDRQRPCRPCTFSVCPIGHPCSREITAEEVAAQARAVLARTPPARVPAAQA